MPTGHESTSPSGFNNTGQIFGQADGDCYAWTKSAFARLTLPPAPGNGSGCAANAINDAKATTGQYEIVGRIFTEYSYADFAFAVIAGPGGFTRTRIYYPYAPSSMLGVDAGQTTVSRAALSPYDSRLLKHDAYYGGSSAGYTLTLLQRPVPQGSGVHVLMPNQTLQPCPFGGCVINKADYVLGFDPAAPAANGVAIYKPGPPATIVDLPVPWNYYGCCEPYAFNDADQILYDDNQQFTSVKLAPAVYEIDTGMKTLIPLPSQNCTNANEQPIGMDNSGEVLGHVTTCDGYSGYYLWDAVHGCAKARSASAEQSLHDLSDGDQRQRPDPSELERSATLYYWATLDPVASTASPSTRRHR